MESVFVLMSTYNGEKYIKGQIDSILEQKNVDVNLIIRDDGSTDRTVPILEKYMSDYENITIIEGENIGVGKSFMSLLYGDYKADYYAFADQDDIWHLDKIAVAISFLKNEDGCCLYVCNQNCVNKDRDFISKRFSEEYDGSNLLKSVFGNYFSGCTMVMNNKLRNLLLERRPNFNFFEHRIHDAWIACVAYAAGKVIYDSEPHMDFRRHETNVSDEYSPEYKTNILKLYAGKVKRFAGKRRKLKNGVSLTAANLLLLFDNYLSEDEKNCLECLSKYGKHYINKMRLLRSKMLWENVDSKQRISVVVKIILGWL